MTSGLGARAATISLVTVAGLLLSGAAAAVPSASKDVRPSTYTVPDAPPLCDAVACVHYVTTTDDAPPLTDANGNGVPDEPQAVLAALQRAWQIESGPWVSRRPRRTRVPAAMTATTSTWRTARGRRAV